jgi:hypothetical protein
VGDGGAIAYSEHGYVWESMNSGVVAHLRAVGWTGSSFIACGAEGRILRSPDGKTWQSQVLSGAANFQDVFLAMGKVHVVGSSTLAISVDDGFGWAIQDLGVQANLKRGCASPNGVLLYSDSGGIRRFFRESAPGSWETMAAPGQRPLTGLGFHEEKGFLAVNDYGVLLLSADAVTWSTSAETLSGAGAISGVEDGWIVAGSQGEILWVGRGRGWNVPVPLQASAHTVARHAGRYYAFGHYGWIHSSTDGVNWNSSYGGSSADVLRSSVSFNDQLIVVGANGAVRRIDAGGGVSFGYVGRLVDLRAVASSGTRIVAVGMGGVISRSDDGQSWLSVTSPVTDDLHAVIHSNGRFHAVGENGVMIESLDGVAWEVGTTGAEATLFGIAATDAGLVAVGGGGVILRKVASGAWHTEESGVMFDLHAVLESDTGLLVCGDAGTLLSKAGDGLWTSERTGISGACDLRSAVFTDGRLLLVGSSGFYEESVSASASTG